MLKCPSNAPLTVEPVDDFVEIPIENFVQGSSIQFDVHIRLQSSSGQADGGRFVKLAECAGDLSLDRIESFREKGVQYLYLSASDFEKYLAFESQVIAAAVKSGDIPPHKKIRLVRSSLDVVYSRLMNSDLKEKDFQFADRVVENAVLTAMALNDGDSLMSSLSRAEQGYTHASTVSLIATMIAKKLRWVSSTALRKVALAGFFHDIGKRDFPKELLMTPREKMTESQRSVYDTHPIFGAEILGRVGKIPDDVVKAVLQHHECLDGSGFPGKLSHGKIQPIALLVGISNLFVHRYLSDDAQSDVSVVLKELLTEHRTKCAGDAIIALHELFGKQIEEEQQSHLTRGGLKLG